MLKKNRTRKTPMVKWDAWHQDRQKRYAENNRQEQELVHGQRRRLEALLQRQDRQQRSDALEAILARAELTGPDLQELSELLAQSPEAEQGPLVKRISAELRTRFGSQHLQPPLPPALSGLLRLLSAHAQGPGEPGSRRRSQVQIQDLTIAGLELEDLDLRGAGLSQCRFEAARLPRLNLFAARLERVGFARAQLEHANFTGATLIQVDLSAADLQHAELISAELHHCDLRGANLNGATLRGLRLIGCELGGASLEQSTGLSFQQLLGSRIDQQTRLPEALRSRQAELLARSRT